MDLLNKQVLHEVFGMGNVINYDDSYISIKFDLGDKKFVYPDAFARYLTLVDEDAANMMDKKIQKQEARRREIERKLEKERAKQRKQQALMEQERKMGRQQVHPALQSVFWCKPEEQEKIFAKWNIFTGTIKSGNRKGEPRRLARLNRNSACLITEREPDMSEEDRRIMGLFMVDEAFDGRTCEDGYIPAHPEYRIRLSEQESRKLLFWNYYVNKREPNRVIWNSGRQRYFKNVWMAQILRDIVSLKEEGSKDREHSQRFFEYFCIVNQIQINELPKPNGALMRG